MGCVMLACILAVVVKSYRLLEVLDASEADGEDLGHARSRRSSGGSYNVIVAAFSSAGAQEVPEHLLRPHRALRKFQVLGVASERDASVLREYFSRVNALEFRRNLEFDGNRVYVQEFFVASFPGIYEGVWKMMTEGFHKDLLSCACVFFQDKAGGINGKHAEPCLCEFLATAADEGADRT
jgi:hypothetical protein